MSGIDRVPVADPAAEYRELAAEIDAALQRVLASGRYFLGHEGAALERAGVASMSSYRVPLRRQPFYVADNAERSLPAAEEAHALCSRFRVSRNCRCRPCNASARRCARVYRMARHGS